MKINWIPIKKINNKKVGELISISLKNNQFTNNGPNVQLSTVNCHSGGRLGTVFPRTFSFTIPPYSA